MKNHLKRIAAPKTWDIKRKINMFITRPMPSGHGLNRSISINTLFKEMIKCAKTNREVRYILRDKEVLLDGKRVKDPRRAVGLMDVLHVKDTKESYRIIINNQGKIAAIPIKGGEENIKVCKIIAKSLLKKGKLQLNLNDGKNILVEKDEYKVGDSVVLDLNGLKIKETLNFKDGAQVYMTGGKHIGIIGVLKGTHGNDYLVKTKENKEFIAKKHHIFIIGKDKPVLTIQL